MPRRPLACLALAALSVSVLARADSNTRPIRSPEKKAYLRVLAAFDKALPKAPAGWTQFERTTVEAPDVMTEGAEEYPIRFDFLAKWQDPAKVKAEAALHEKAISGMAAKGPDTGSDALFAENEKLANAMGAAAERGDMKEMERLQKKMEANAVKLHAHNAPIDSARDADLAKSEVHDLEVQVSFIGNETEQRFAATEAATEPLLAGLLVYREGDGAMTSYGWEEGTTYVFVGNWKASSEEGETVLSSAPRAGASYVGVQTIVVRVKAERKRARALLASMDWAALKALLER